MSIRPNRVKQKLAAGEVAIILSGTNDPDLIDQLVDPPRTWRGGAGWTARVLSVSVHRWSRLAQHELTAVDLRTPGRRGIMRSAFRDPGLGARELRDERAARRPR